MTSTAWSTIITIKDGNKAVRQMRAVLRRDLAVAPYRHNDVVARYLRHVIDSSATPAGIQAEIATVRSCSATPRGKGLEQELRSLLAPPSPRLVRQLKQLARCAFGALVLLAFIVTFAG